MDWARERGNGYKRLTIALAVLGFITGIFVDRMVADRREAAMEQRFAAFEKERASRDTAQAETLARMESRLRSIEAGYMEVLVQLAELNAQLAARDERRRGR